MKSTPMLFNADMVRAILSGSKTQTRRVIKPKRHGSIVGSGSSNGIAIERINESEFSTVLCPFGKVGDRLWVRETFAEVGTGDPGWLLYRASNYMEQIRKYGFDTYLPEDKVKWTPSIHMPRWASRIQLEITGVRVERLNDCSEADAMAEGCNDDYAEGYTLYWFDGVGVNKESGRLFAYNSKEAYSWLWESINGAGSWSVNPWVWVIEFEVLK